MEAVICIVLALWLHTYAKGASTPQCAGTRGTVMFMPNIDGKVTGFQRYSKKGTGDITAEQFAIYNTQLKKFTHYEAGRNISVVNNFSLEFQSLQKSDEGMYYLALSVEMPTGEVKSRESNTILIVMDPCFDRPKMVNKCYETTCYTSNGGTLKYNGKNMTEMMVRVCDAAESREYDCCSSSNKCISQKIQGPKDDDGNGKKKLTIGIPIAIVVALLVVAIVIAVVLWRRKQRRNAGGSQIDEGRKRDDTSTPLTQPNSHE